MAHHVAELLAAVDAAQNGTVKRKRRGEAAKAITTLWAHRSTYENRINPLSELTPIIQVIRTLDRSRNRWLTRNDGARHVYDAFRRLMICLLLRHAESITQVSQAISSAKKTAQFQNSDEREILSAIDVWIEGAAELPERKGHRRSSNIAVEKIDLDEAISTLIDEARSALDAVAEEAARARKNRTPIGRSASTSLK